MKFELNNLPRNCPDEDVLSEIRRVDLIVNQDFLTQKDYNAHGKITSDGIKLRFGCWQNALVAAGLGHKYADTIDFRKRRLEYSDDEILAELKRVAGDLKKDSLSIEDFRSHSNLFWPGVVVRRFGSWIVGLQKAGLKISTGYRRAYSNEQFFENLLNVWTYYGRQPLYREMDVAPSIIRANTYAGRFGSWHKALETFVKQMNSETCETVVERPETNEAEKLRLARRDREVQPSISREDRRSIGLSLRYKVLSRDGFRCVRCGRSPATHIGLELHVDHKEPFSKQGKTVLENLETKCRDCNLGKGNRHSE